METDTKNSLIKVSKYFWALWCMLVITCIWEAAKNHGFMADLGNITKPCLKTKKKKILQKQFTLIILEITLNK